MPNFSFLFSGALLALPLAALPVILHLLFRRKSPVVMFSTIRFIQASVQRTAARKRVQKWLLLACRVLVLAMLIFAVAQLVHLPTAGGAWTSSKKSAIATIVVDTSYSMQLQDHQEPLLHKADAAVRELLAERFANAKVAIFRSLPSASGPERLTAPGAILAEWTQLAPQANPRPLVDRIAAAADLLDREQSDDKWLVVISDFQKHEFPSQFPKPKGGHVVMIDMHPDDPRSAGITRVAIDPPQPTPGTGSEAVIDVIGKPNTSHPLTVSATTAAGAKLAETGVQIASLDSGGHARLRVPLHLPAQPWMLLKAALADEDDMPWDNSRAQLIQTPPRQKVTLLGPKPTPDSMAFPVWLALDPSEGTHPETWSLAVKAGNTIAPDANVAVLLAEDWPDDARTNRLLNFVRGGGTLIFFLRPGLEQTWAKLPLARRTELLVLLPSPPMTRTMAAVNTVSVSAEADPLLSGFARDKFDDIVVRRVVPFSADPQGTLLLNCFPKDPRPGMEAAGLLYRRAVAAGTVYTIATLPDRQYTNLEFHPLFLPLLVRMSQRSLARSAAQNVEIGQPITLIGRQFDNQPSMTMQGPQNDMTVVKAQRINGVVQFPFGVATAPGLYTWLQPGSNEPAAMTHVQLPATESELFYTPAALTTAPGDDVMVARSVAELKARSAKLSEAEPMWQMSIALVLLLLCAEALMGSLSRLWKPISLRAFVPGTKGETALG
ncbi:MAG TPA: BatA and WFA domain-containing protein [Tepidisphaeraceae bacterium]|jgi:hypothetical protein|nr:BatA and WFA domain-containing protein [Tepidisphaeraceae bacterium]